jgi:hypothetical protein
METGRGWKRRVIRWEVGEKDKEGRFSGKDGKNAFGGWGGEKEHENN